MVVPILVLLKFRIQEYIPLVSLVLSSEHMVEGYTESSQRPHAN